MLHKEDGALCDRCGKLFQLKKVYKFTWRYSDKVRTYVGSTSKLIHGGYNYFCRKCLAKFLKEIGHDLH